MRDYIDLFISPVVADAEARRAMREGRAATVEVVYAQIGDQQGYVVKLFDMRGDAAGVLPEDGALSIKSNGYLGAA